MSLRLAETDAATYVPPHGAPDELVLVERSERAERAPAVGIDRLSKSFLVRRGWQQVLRRPFDRPRATVLDDVTFDVAEGEFFGLLGPNGAGKTTLFRMLTTSVIPDEGSAHVFGYSVEHEPGQVRGSVSCVMANDRSLYWRLSAVENLRLFAALYDMHGPVARQRIADVLALVGLPDVGAKMVGLYSSGMRQRLLIARALLPRPRLLLLDEPTRSLDPIAAEEFRGFLRSDVATASGCTVLLATHSSEEAMQLCDRVAILDRGRLLAVGTTDELDLRFGDRAFVVWTRTPEHAAFTALAADGVAVTDRSDPDADGWSTVRLTIPGSLADASAVLRALSAAGVDVARFEREELDLATLLRRVVAARRTP